jgi:ATP-dependent Lon protease
MDEQGMQTKKLPMVPLRGMNVFPYVVMHFDVGRETSLAALEEAMIDNQELFLVAQHDVKEEEPKEEDLYTVGTVVKVKQILKMPENVVRVLIEGLMRAKLIGIEDKQQYWEASFIECRDEDNTFDEIEAEARMRYVVDLFNDYVQGAGNVSPEAYMSINALKDPGRLADTISSNVLVDFEDKQRVLEVLDPVERLEVLSNMMQKEIKISKIDHDIHRRVKSQIEEMQKEHYLREQLKAIQEELGEHEGNTEEIQEYRSKILALELDEEIEQKTLKEVDRLGRTPMGNPEGGIIRNYLDWVLSLPWKEHTKDNLDLKNANKILNKEHYGLEKLKDRVIEYLAVRQLTNTMKGPILCFVGPPGVGKTSIAKSIAHAVNRKFVRMSLGGVRDEAEIRGHRRTYIGARPGRIISLMKQAGTNNPVLLLDEIDKMASDFRGDPGAALLEVLDSEQNNTFTDHYLEMPFDLSSTMFLATANSLDPIPAPLLDRMEIIRIAGYTEEEKLNIAIKYLLPKQLKAHGLKRQDVSFPQKMIRNIIKQYTSEAGVRGLEREIATVCRKVARIKLEEDKEKITINKSNIDIFLGTPRYREDARNKTNLIGSVTGLAWTAVGGVTLQVEAVPMNGTGKLSLTGQMGDVMKESAQAGLSYVRSKIDELNLEKDFYKKTDIHIHIPEGAIPKDGPSAGVTMATAVISALTQTPVDNEIAMTGEITLRGNVLPIGGLKEKALAAHRFGIKKIVIPEANAKDIEEIPIKIREQLTIVLAKTMDDVLKHALIKE